MSIPRATESSSLVFATEGDGGFAAYHDLYSSGTTASRTGGPFRAAVSAHQFPRMILFNRQVAGAAHHRAADRVRRDGFDHINLQVLRSGRMAAGQPGHERPMAPGDIVLFDTTCPQRTVVAEADYVSVAISRDAITTAVPDVRGLHGTILSGGAAGLLGDFLLSLGRHIARVTPAVASEGAAMVGTLLNEVIACDPPRTARKASLATLEMLRWRAEAYIDAHLDDRALDVDAVAAGIGVARTTLYAAFARGDGIARQILGRRVRRLGKALLHPAETRSVSALAFDLGFANENHCSRAFKASFGVPPGQFRAASRRMRAAPSAAPAGDGWADWWGHLS